MNNKQQLLASIKKTMLTQPMSRSQKTKLINKNKAIARRRQITAGLRRNPLNNPSHFQTGGGGIRGETKSLDVVSNAFTLNSTPAFQVMNLIRAGSSYFNRIGRKIHMKSFHMSGNIYLAGNATQQVEFIRISLVYDKQANGALPAFTDIFQDTDQAGTNSSGVQSNLNLNNRDRFVLLRDMKLLCGTNPAGQVAGIPATWVDSKGCVTGVFNEFVKLNLETQYGADSAPAVIGDIRSGSLLFITSGSQAAGGEGYALNASLRLRFHDQ